MMNARSDCLVVVVFPCTIVVGYTENVCTMTSQTHHPLQSVELIVIEGLSHRDLLQFNEHHADLAALFGKMYRSRLALTSIAGKRNGLAATLLCGVGAEEHGVSGRREPDPTALCVRNVDADSFLVSPLPSGLAAQGMTASAIGWPCLEPVTTFETPETRSLFLVGESALHCRGGAEATWLLPPRSVLPDSFRAHVAEHRRFPTSHDYAHRIIARNQSVQQIATAIRTRERPCFLAQWVIALNNWMLKQLDNRTALVNESMNAIHSLLSDAMRGGDAHGAVVVVLPPNSAASQTEVDAMVFMTRECSAWLGSRCAFNDYELVGLIESMLGAKCKQRPPKRCDNGDYVKTMNQRASAFKEAGYFPQRTRAMKQVFARETALRAKRIGIALATRGEWASAREWLLNAIRDLGDPISTIWLIRALFGLRDEAALRRVAGGIRKTRDLADLAKCAAFLAAGTEAEAKTLLESFTPKSPSACVLAMEFALRAGSPERAASLFAPHEKYAVTQHNFRMLRLGLIAARKSDHPALRTTCAQAILTIDPDRSRLRRFVRSG